MAILGEITHTTSYRYVKPVTFGTHRAMFLNESKRPDQAATDAQPIYSPHGRQTAEDCHSAAVGCTHNLRVPLSFADKAYAG